jgi:hypothetical protein
VNENDAWYCEGGVFVKYSAASRSTAIVRQVVKKKKPGLVFQLVDTVAPSSEDPSPRPVHAETTILPVGAGRDHPFA